VEGRELSGPLGIALDNSVSPPIIYIADTANNRVLAFQYATQLKAGATADLVLGQPDRFTNVNEGPGTAYSTGLNSPTGLAVDNAGNLYVADTGDNRILRYPKPFAQTPSCVQPITQWCLQFPNMIIGQTTFSGSGANTGGVKASTLSLAGGRTGLAFDATGNLWVTDSGNNRVLRFPVAVLNTGANGPSGDLAIGQPDLVSNAAATTPITKSGLRQPTGIAFDSAGDMLVADQLGRVVVYPPGVGTNASATRIVGVVFQQQGQPPPASVSAMSLGNTIGVAALGTNIAVTDTGNNRVLIYGPVSSWPAESTQFSPSAIAVIGQNTFGDSMANQGGQASSATLSSPVDIAASSTEMFVADSLNNRVLVYAASGGNPVPTATRVVGQLDFPYTAPNLIEGKEFYTAGSSSSASGSAILDFSSTPPHLYVADTYNNRILGFNNFNSVKNGQAADIVIGQPDLFHSVINFPSNLAGTPTQQGLYGPTSLAVDSIGNLYVADTFNSRILRFPTPFAPPSGATSPQSADLVLGQANFTSIVTDTTPQTMSAPISLAFTQDGANATVTNSGYLVVADANQNRVLFFQKPFSNGMNATTVLGQVYFSGKFSGSGASGLTSPRGVAVDPQDRVLVADTGNGRVQVFDQAKNLSNDAAASFSLTSGLSQPISIAMGPDGQFWVADVASTANHLLHYPSVETLPAKNYASDATQPAVSPRSGFVDQFSNLLVADGINRILYFAPQVAPVNAANYITGRPLAPGAFAAIFPSVTTNSIANGNAGVTQFPLPTVLADTQVLINGNPIGMFFVSTGQINVPLPLELPTGGTVDLQVIRQSTGQIYGGAEVPMAPASPALFTNGGTGTGEVAALNQDNSVNSPTNPIARGQVIQLFGTGQGQVVNPPPDNMPSTGQVSTTATPQVLIGGSGSTYIPASNILYSGLAPSLIGVWQINVTIPSTATTGSYVPIRVFMDSTPSDNPAVPGQVATTISIK
jgi:uncharacterized protein (TIGR03437 family)